MANPSEQFYSDLPIRNARLSDLVANTSLFVKVPEDWQILVADIKNSTQIINEGRHQEVNLIATGSVIAILNLAAKDEISIPFFFGGDGAVILVPPKMLQSSISALQKHSKNTFKNFGFILKVGHISVKEIYNNNHELKLARARISDIFSIPVVLGDGLQFAENLIKTNNFNIEEIQPDNSPLDLDGMECKWNKIKPPEDNQEVVSLLVSTFGNQDSSILFSKVLKAIDEIYGSPKNRKPISIKRLNLNSDLKQIRTEIRTKLGKFDSYLAVKNWVKIKFGNFYFNNSKSGKDYLEKLIKLTDTISLDGRINTVISGTTKQRDELILFLDKLEQQNFIRYGLHVSNASVMSCYVKDMSSNSHIHFVDGVDGGYTKAANHLKDKLR